MEKREPNIDNILMELKRKNGRARLTQLTKKLGVRKKDLRSMLLNHPELRLLDEDWVELLPFSSIHIETRC